MQCFVPTILSSVSVRIFTGPRRSLEQHTEISSQTTVSYIMTPKQFVSHLVASLTRSSLLKPVIVVPVNAKKMLLLTNAGTLDVIPSTVQHLPKAIDFEGARRTPVHKQRGLTSPPFNCPIQLLGLRRIYSSAAQDRYAMGRIILIAANQGIDPFECDKSLIECPPKLRVILMRSIDFSDLPEATRFEKLQIMNLLYRTLYLYMRTNVGR
jgi:hypothetical protein